MLKEFFLSQILERGVFDCALEIVEYEHGRMIKQYKFIVIISIVIKVYK